MLASTTVLPSLYESSTDEKAISSLFCRSSFPPPATDISPVVEHLKTLKAANSRAWAAVRAILNDSNSAHEEMMCLHWRTPHHDDHPNFHPFERLLTTSCHDVSYVLTSLLNVRPVPGWWDEKARTNFLEFFGHLLRYFCFSQVRG